MLSRVGPGCPGVLQFAASELHEGAFEVEESCPYHGIPSALGFWRVCGHRLPMEMFLNQPLIWPLLLTCLRLWGHVLQPKTWVMWPIGLYESLQVGVLVEFSKLF